MAAPDAFEAAIKSGYSITKFRRKAVSMPLACFYCAKYLLYVRRCVKMVTPQPQLVSCHGQVVQESRGDEDGDLEVGCQEMTSLRDTAR